MVIKPTDIYKYFQRLSMEDLQKIPDIGSTVAESIYDWFHDEHNIKLLEKLQKAGIEVEIPELQVSSLRFQDKTFVLTGELESFSRDEAKAKIRELGGDVSSSVSKNTDFVVVGKNPGAKYDKAKELGVKIIREKEFARMIKE
jgi:DNA ligase (NAD+)